MNLNESRFWKWDILVLNEKKKKILKFTLKIKNVWEILENCWFNQISL